MIEQTVREKIDLILGLVKVMLLCSVLLFVGTLSLFVFSTSPSDIKTEVIKLNNDVRSIGSIVKVNGETLKKNEKRLIDAEIKLNESIRSQSK